MCRAWQPAHAAPNQPAPLLRRHQHGPHLLDISVSKSYKQPRQVESEDQATVCSTMVTLHGVWPHDREAIAACSVATFSSVPSQFQYFTNNANKGGILAQADYCPY